MNEKMKRVLKALGVGLVVAIYSGLILELVFGHRNGEYRPYVQALAALSVVVSYFHFGGLKIIDIRNWISDNSSRSNDPEYLSYLARAEREVNEKTYDAGMWSLALVNARGDESKRKVEYMQLRVKQLKRVGG